MKKSTLITTIAMIVVVVVALSTATYAWFTANTYATASANMTTQASGDWQMLEGTVTLTDLAEPAAVGAASLAFDGDAKTSITYTNTLNGDVWAPYSTIGATIASNGASTTIANMPSFANCTVETAGNVVQKKYDYATAGTAAVDNATHATGGFIKPLALRVTNVSGQAKTLQMNITINAGSSGTNKTMYAGAAVRFYIYEISSAASDNTATYTSGYMKTGDMSAATLGTTTAATNSAAATAAESNNTGVTLMNYGAGNIASNYTEAPAKNDALGYAQGDKIHTYTFDMQNYAVDGYANIIIYCWIDGYVADASAGNADFNIVFAFTSKSN